MNTSKRIHQMTVPQWEKAFPDDDACAAYLAKHRWPMAAHCPHCCSDSTYELTTMKCALPAARAGPTASPCSLAGSSKIPNIGLRMWIRVIHVMLTSKRTFRHIRFAPRWASALTAQPGICAIGSALASLTKNSTNS